MTIVVLSTIVWMMEVLLAQFLLRLDKQDLIETEHVPDVRCFFLNDGNSITHKCLPLV